MIHITGALRRAAAAAAAGSAALLVFNDKAFARPGECDQVLHGGVDQRLRRSQCTWRTARARRALRNGPRQGLLGHVGPAGLVLLPSDQRCPKPPIQQALVSQAEDARAGQKLARKMLLFLFFQTDALQFLKPIKPERGFVTLYRLRNP